MGPREIGSSEEGMIHLGPPQIERREIHPRQVGGCEIRAASLAPLRFNVEQMRRQDPPDLVGRQYAAGRPCRKVDLTGEGRSRPLRFCHAAIIRRSAAHDTRASCPREGYRIWLWSPLSRTSWRHMTHGSPVEILHPGNKSQLAARLS